MLTTSFLACTAPRLLAPAMNDRMYADAATQANLAILRERGVVVIEPEEGPLASRGEFGRGRLPEPAALLARIEAVLPAGERPWDGLRVLVTAGGTREPLDAVRFIGNRSSGRMGLALAGAAARRGAEVTLIAANVELAEPAGVRRIDVVTAAELETAVSEEFGRAHLLLMAAAPADFRPETVAEGKIRRAGEGLELRLEPTADILAWLAAKRAEGQTIVGFAAEHGEGGRGAGPGEAGAQGRRHDRPQRRLRPRDRVRVDQERGHPGRGRLRAASSPSTPRRRSPRRSSTGSRPCASAPARLLLRLSPRSRASYTLQMAEIGDQATQEESTYRLWRRGVELLEDGSFGAATVPLAEAARRAPEKSSVREALGRAYFRNRQFDEAAAEFEAVLETHPVNDYAHFCLGRALSITGDLRRARHHLALASNLRPERRDYRIYRERLARSA